MSQQQLVTGMLRQQLRKALEQKQAAQQLLQRERHQRAHMQTQEPARPAPSGPHAVDADGRRTTTTHVAYATARPLDPPTMAAGSCEDDGAESTGGGTGRGGDDAGADDDDRAARPGAEAAAAAGYDSPSALRDELRSLDSEMLSLHQSLYAAAVRFGASLPS